jgi:long-chain fatty acid transport protein
MIRSPRLVPCCALVLAALASPAPARADDSNYRPYAIGVRAAGMGGAFTALADDGSGPFYNPAGVAFVERSQLSLSGSVYGVVSGTFEDALGTTGRNFSYSGLNTFPTTTAAIWKIGGPGPSERANVIAVSVYLPDALTIDDRTTIESRENAFFLGTQTQTVWAGVTYARRLGRLGFGASLFGLFGTAIRNFDLTVVLPTDTNAFATVTSRTDATTYGVVGALGARLDLSDQLRLGLSLYSPELGTGTRKSFTRIAFGASTAAPGLTVLNVEDLTASPTLPLRAQAGVAWTSGRFTLTGDVIFLAGRTVHDDAGRETIVNGAPVPLDQRIVRNAVVNGAVGAEYVIDDRFPLRAGFYTDFAASNDPSPTGNVVNTSHMDRYVGTLSIGYRTEHTSTSLGVNLAMASGTDLVPGEGIDFAQLRRSRSTQTLAYVFLGTSYEF